MTIVTRESSQPICWTWTPHPPAHTNLVDVPAGSELCSLGPSLIGTCFLEPYPSFHWSQGQNSHIARINCSSLLLHLCQHLERQPSSCAQISWQDGLTAVKRENLKSQCYFPWSGWSPPLSVVWYQLHIVSTCWSREWCDRTSSAHCWRSHQERVKDGNTSIISFAADSLPETGNVLTWWVITAVHILGFLLNAFFSSEPWRKSGLVHFTWTPTQVPAEVRSSHFLNSSMSMSEIRIF